MVVSDLLKCCSKFTKQIHSILKDGGTKALEEDFVSKNCKISGNFFLKMDAIQQIMRYWDDILLKLEKVSIQLEKGEKASILAASKELAKSVTNLQTFIVGTFVEIGSFVPGPIGIVCSIALAITCFATGNILGGFVNLLGAIPFAKCAKFLPRATFTRILSDSGLNAFKPASFERYMNGLSSYIKDFTYNNKFISVFERNIEKTQRTTNNVIQWGGALGKTPNSINTGVRSSNRILNNTADGWNKAREELLGMQAFEHMFK